MDNREISALNIPRIISQFSLAAPAIGQCDACSPIVFGQYEIPPSDSVNITYGHKPVHIHQPVDSTHWAVLSPFTTTFSVLNESAMNCLQHFSTPKPLENIPSTWSENWGKATVQSTLGQMIRLALLVPEDYERTEVCTPEEVPNTLAAWLHITDRCNLRCTYCYLPHKDAEMSIETGKAAIEATFRSAVAHKYREVKFKYAGGEPLLRLPLVAELHRYAQRLADQHGLALDGVVLSNGTLLTRNMLKEIQDLKLGLMVSLDHLAIPQEESQRRYSDGRDASKDAMRAIELALDSGVVPSISITVSERNIGHVPELLEWVLARDLPFSLNFYREKSPLFPFRKGRKSCPELGLNLEEDKLITGLLKAYKVIESNLSRQSLLASLADLANFAAPHLRRCSVGHSYLVFDCQGRVSKCQMQMDRPVTDIHAEDPLAMIRADEIGIQNGTVDEKEGCQECPWRYWCAGGCPLETYRVTGRYDVKSPNCSIYKALYPEVLRLEGLRLLKYAGEVEHR